jgi:hypothetical protein
VVDVTPPALPTPSDDGQCFRTGLVSSQQANWLDEKVGRVLECEEKGLGGASPCALALKLTTAGARNCSEVFVQLLGEDFEEDTRDTGDRLSPFVERLKSNVIKLRGRGGALDLEQIMRTTLALLSADRSQYRFMYNNRELLHSKKVCLRDIGAKTGDCFRVQRVGFNALLGGGIVLSHLRQRPAPSSCFEIRVEDNVAVPSLLPVAKTVSVPTDLTPLRNSILNHDCAATAALTILDRPANVLSLQLQRHKAPTPAQKKEIKSHLRRKGILPKPLPWSLLANTCCGKTRRLNALIRRCTEGTVFCNVRFPEGHDKTTSKPTSVTWTEDIENTDTRIMVNGVPFMDSEGVNSVLEDQLTHRQESSIDYVDHDHDLEVVFVNFEINFEGLEIRDLPGGASLTMENDEQMQQRGFEEGVAAMMVKISGDKNSAILNLAKRTPRFKNDADRVLMYTFLDEASAQDRKDALSPMVKTKLKALFHLTDIITSTKDDYSSFFGKIQYYHELHWKKLLVWFLSDTKRTFADASVHDECHNFLQESTIKGIASEANIILGMVHEHDDFTLSQMNLCSSSGDVVKRGPERAWFRFIEVDISEWMLHEIGSIITKNTGHDNISANVEKLPVFGGDDNGLTVPFIILDETRKTITFTQSFLLRKTLEYFFLHDRKGVIAQFLTACMDNKQVRLLSENERGFIENLYTSACQIEIRECVREYESRLAKSYEGYVRHCVQIVHEKLKNSTYATAFLVEKSHKTFFEKAIVGNAVSYKELVYQAMRNVPVRMKDRLINELESSACVSP